VSKGTVREAMRILEAQGLVVTRTGPGGGSFVGEVTAERARSLLANYFYFQELTVSDIYQLRKLLEPELSASLAGRLSREQLDRLRTSPPASTPPPPRRRRSATSTSSRCGSTASLRNTGTIRSWASWSPSWRAC
jgi:GntR family transcriptional repressor for pyruvate dehydrogenase complex